MEILKTAIAGTLESSDAQVTVEPLTDDLVLSVDSIVMNQYGRQIKMAALSALEQMGVATGKITIVDKGALECTLKARIECAVYRSMGKSDQAIPWEVM